MERRRCPYCGHKIPKYWDLCLYCGKDIEPIIESSKEIVVNPYLMNYPRVRKVPKT